MFGNAGRPQGVQVAQSQLNPPPVKEVPANTVLHAVECSMVAVQYTDAQGREHKDVFLKAGNEIYKPMQSEEWTDKLTTLMPWLKEGIMGKLETERGKNEGVPTQDTVDIVAGAVAKEGSTVSVPASPPAQVSSIEDSADPL